ncbi:fructosamine kinase family protein [Rugosimonospora africana]|uniref:Fructosamine kinase n=1 Tax=Rugosimonospora africana TaxID=556532 RepID=A0A8J3QUK8_9ACTN|nr:fructosamine kinase family protein [Rugosimonospora africana]GIH16382.1 fructosamine kinase [Rugosimonospora africana]
MTDLPAVREALAAAGLTGAGPFDRSGSARLTPRDDPDQSPEMLAGGDNSTAWRVRRPDGSAVVVKAFGKPGGLDSTAAPDDLFEVEAQGLAALRIPGGFVIPDVLAVTPHALVLQSLLPRPHDDVGFWERAGHALAATHGVTDSCFGWHRDGWLGSLRQENGWHEDGHAFYATHRILRYLKESPVDAALTAEDRAGLHRICQRLPQLIPPAPATITHGDLAPANVMATPDGRPALIDPAVSFTWPEVDLSMLYWVGLAWPGARVPDRFFDAYAERRPIADGWRDRAPLLHLRELLSLIAHGDQRRDFVADVRHIIRVFR